MKLEWQNAPATTWWGHDMVVATVALGKDDSVDLYCARSKTAEAEALLKKPWVGLTEKEQDAVFKTFSKSEAYKLNFLNRVASAIEAKLKEKNT